MQKEDRNIASECYNLDKVEDSRRGWKDWKRNVTCTLLK